MGWLSAQVAGARGHLFPWAAVMLAAGAALWLGWRGPTLSYSLAAGALALAAAVAHWRLQAPLYRAAAAGLLALTLGFALAELRSAQVAAPVLGFRYYGPIEGRIREIDRSATDRLRLVLDQVGLQRLAPERVPGQVRLSLQTDTPPELTAGMRIRTTGHLSPPEGPTEPGGFDFQRHAWFRGLGAIGYSRTPVEVLSEAASWPVLVTRLRHHLSAGIRRHIAGEPGAFAAAMLTGDRAAMGPGAVQALRDANLYHLVSISGVHMSLLTGFVFLGLRSLLALVPPLALRLPIHKMAALVALGVAAFYLVLAGGDVATLRAFVMVAVMLVAVLLGRRAISLRSVAVAAVLLLALQPEAVADPGFQMSFAATAALIAGYRQLGGWLTPGRSPLLLRLPLGLVAASAFAGFASAPFAAVHFNRFSDYGLIANVVSAPLMGMLVMPAGAMAALLAPFGLAAPALWVLGLGCRALLWIAETVAGWEGAVRLVAQPGPGVLPLLGLAMAAATLGGRGLRLAGGAGLALALLLWAWPMRPELLVSSDGRLLGLQTPEGRALSRPRGAGFSARNWLENDGDAASQEIAAQRPGFVAVAEGLRFQLGESRGLQLLGKGAGQRIAAACRSADIVVLAEPAIFYPPGCLVLDAALLRETGALALRAGADGLRLELASAPSRPWSPPVRRGSRLASLAPYLRP